MHPARTSLAGAMRILNLLSRPAEAKYGGWSSHRRAITPKPEHGCVPIVGPNGLYYANIVGPFGVVSTGQNCDRLESAAHRWALKLAED